MEMASMNKSDLTAALADKVGLTEKQAPEIINLIFDGFTYTLKKDTEFRSGVSGLLL